MTRPTEQYWDRSWSPVTGCTPASAGCDHCWARTMVRRFPSLHGYFVIDGEGDPHPFSHVVCHRERLDKPLKWRKPQVVSLSWLGDLFHDDVPDEFICDVIGTMAKSHWHTYLVLTKRPARMMEVLLDWRGMQHVWLGVSVEDQATADERIPLLLQTPAAHRWVSVEPMLGAVDLAAYLDGPTRWSLATGATRPDWVVCGGESGPSARPMHPDWARSLRGQCASAGVPFFFKQWGEWLSGSRLVDLDYAGAGRTELLHARDDCSDEPAWVRRVGKKVAGRELDGVTHDATPWGGAR